MAVILFDIDKTVFDTPRLFGDFYRPQLAKLSGKSEQEVYELIGDYQETLDKNTDFNPDDLALFLAEKTGAKPESIRAILFEPESFRQSLFPETKKVLSALQAHHALGVFSEAQPDWQAEKIRLAGIEPFFDPELMFIFTRKEEAQALTKIPSGAWIIDDNPGVIETLTAEKKVKPIWLNRKGVDSPLAEIVPTISSLNQVADLVEKL